MPEELIASTKLFIAVLTHGVSRKLFDVFIKIFNNYIGACLPHLASYYRSRKAVRDHFPLKSTIHVVCPKGCMMMTPETLDNNECHHCHQSFLLPDGQPKRVIEQLSLHAQLEIIVKNDESRDLIKYGQRPPIKDEMHDMIDSRLVKKCTQAGFFDGDINLKLMLFTDDFRPFKQSTRSMMLVHAIVLDFPPEVRYEQNNMIQICITPGPRTVDAVSFLQPMIDDLKLMGSEEGIKVELSNKETVKVKAHLLVVGGDIPAVAKLAGHVGHISYFGCRLCEVKGSRQFYTQALFKDCILSVFLIGKHNGVSLIFPPETDNAPMRSKSSYQHSDHAKGQRYASPFADLSTFHGPTFFPPDIMHLLGHGIGHQLWKILRCVYNRNIAGNPLQLDAQARKKLAAQMIASRQTTPASFSGNSCDINQQASYFRAVDWIHFVRYIVPTVVLEFISDEDARRALLSLVQVYEVPFSRRIRKAHDIDLLQGSIAG